MIQLPEDFDSIFRYIVVVSQRAEQIINGAKPRSESRFNKPTLKARDDVDAGEVDWRILTQEELDAHRQAMVEQFRAEVDAASEQQAGQEIPDPADFDIREDGFADRARVDARPNLKAVIVPCAGVPEPTYTLLRD